MKRYDSPYDRRTSTPNVAVVFNDDRESLRLPIRMSEAVIENEGEMVTVLKKGNDTQFIGSWNCEIVEYIGSEDGVEE